MKKRFGKVKDYSEWLEPCIVENTLDLLGKELPKYRNKINILHLCFTTDPFMYKRPDIQTLSLEVLRRANAANVRCSVLTKGILPAELAELPLRNEYGITVVSLSEAFREATENVEIGLAACQRKGQQQCHRQGDNVFHLPFMF